MDKSRIPEGLMVDHLQGVKEACSLVGSNSKPLMMDKILKDFLGDKLDTLTIEHLKEKRRLLEEQRKIVLEDSLHESDSKSSHKHKHKKHKSKSKKKKNKDSKSKRRDASIEESSESDSDTKRKVSHTKSVSSHREKLESEVKKSRKHNDADSEYEHDSPKLETHSTVKKDDYILSENMTNRKENTLYCPPPDKFNSKNEKLLRVAVKESPEGRHKSKKHKRSRSHSGDFQYKDDKRQYVQESDSRRARKSYKNEERSSKNDSKYEREVYKEDTRKSRCSESRNDDNDRDSRSSSYHRDYSKCLKSHSKEKGKRHESIDNLDNGNVKMPEKNVQCKASNESTITNSNRSTDKEATGKSIDKISNTSKNMNIDDKGCSARTDKQKSKGDKDSDKSLSSDNLKFPPSESKIISNELKLLSKDRYCDVESDDSDCVVQDNYVPANSDKYKKDRDTTKLTASSSIKSTSDMKSKSYRGRSSKVSGISNAADDIIMIDEEFTVPSDLEMAEDSERLSKRLANVMQRGQKLREQQLDKGPDGLTTDDAVNDGTILLEAIPMPLSDIPLPGQTSIDAPMPLLQPPPLPPMLVPSSPENHPLLSCDGASLPKMTSSSAAMNPQLPHSTGPSLVDATVNPPDISSVETTNFPSSLENIDELLSTDSQEESNETAASLTSVGSGPFSNRAPVKPGFLGSIKKAPLKLGIKISDTSAAIILQGNRGRGGAFSPWIQIGTKDETSVVASSHTASTDVDLKVPVIEGETGSTADDQNGEQSKTSARDDDKNDLEPDKCYGNQGKERSRDKNRKSTSIDKGRKRSKSRDRKRSKSRDRKRSKSRDRRKCSKSRDRKRSSSKDRKRSKSRERRHSKSSDRKRSRDKDRNRNHSKSQDRKSKDRRRSRSRDRKRSKSRDRKHSSSRSRRRSNERHGRRSDEKRKSRERSSSRKRSSRDERRRRSRSRDRRDQHKRSSRHRSRSPRRTEDKKEENEDIYKIDKAKLREIAIKNVFGNLQTTSSLFAIKPEEIALPTAKKEKTIGKTVEELTDFCKRMVEDGDDATSQSWSRGYKRNEDDDEDGDYSLRNVLKKVREVSTAGFVFQAPTIQQSIIAASGGKPEHLTTMFPVSSGSDHHKKILDLETLAADPNSALTIDDKVFKEVSSDPMEISKFVTERAEAVRKLSVNPNDPEALATIQSIQQKIQEYMAAKQKPGQFTGSTNVQPLSQRQLAGHEKGGYQAWVTKDTFLKAKPVTGGIGKALLQKMGWNEGEGLGKNNDGIVNPIAVDIKFDRKGLTSSTEGKQKFNPIMQQVQNHMNKMGAGGRMPLLGQPGIPALPFPIPGNGGDQGKHPVSALNELCIKRRWDAPSFVLVMEGGPSHNRLFKFKVLLNGVEYVPSNGATTKKQAKSEAAAVCLQAFGISV